jgi:hypothetical protein
MISKEFKIIGSLSTLILILCYLSLIGSAMAADTYINTTNIFPEVETLGGDDVITPHMHYWDNWFAFYNEDLITYYVYMYNYTGTHPDNYTDSFIGIVKHGQVMTLNENASYRIFAEYPDETDFESLEDVKQKVNRYWVIVVVLIIIVVALYTGIRIIRGRRY